uniref:NADH-ubiquinone oxidoreductase chain 4 n=1 Tax=Empoascanara angkhangica TaxID=3057149 RepID=A0AA51NH85_9HEMI|nr:NADH dehydrogenase subunit 4 [Empoascanara angkhangica]WMQ52408.1 NADH dehydrogenase subunit 4 [Empoascanara angkhangica]
MILLYLVFMTPLMLFSQNCWYIIQFSLLLLMLKFALFFMNNYFSIISYFLGLDYYSYGLIFLSLLIVSLMIISSNMIQNNLYSNLFLFVCVTLCMILIIIFSSMNMFIMYMFFEFSLIPLMILIFGWGYQPERLISGLYLFFYTLFASLPLFLLIIYFYMNNYTLFFGMMYTSESFSFIFHFCLIFAFLVKLPMFMVHFWLPKAHVQAPVSGSMILAGLLLKIGGYGILRFMTIFENMFLNYSYIWFSLSMVGGILVSLICFIQGDVKCLIAYSSVAHMSLCLIGLLSMSKWGIVGAYLMMISHGLCSSGLFCLANISYERFSSRSFYINKGLLTFMPSMSAMWFLFSSFNMGCPPSLNFLSEIFILNSMMMFWFNSLYYFMLISFFSACFSVFLFSFTQHGSSNFLYSYSLGYIREYLLLMIHLLPLFFILLGLGSFLI